MTWETTHGLSRTHEYQMWWCCKRNAKRRGLDFNLEPSDIVIPNKCPILGIPITVRNGKIKPTSASVDRIDSTKGYTKGNVHVISYRANVLKNNATVEELEAIVKYIKEKT